jgi:hypothetical protein
MNKINQKNKKNNPYRSGVNRTNEIVSLGLQSELLWLMTYQPFNKFAINNCKSRIMGLKSMKKAYNLYTDFVVVFSNYP